MTKEVEAVLSGFDKTELSKAVAAIINPAVCPHVVELKPEQAAYIYTELNKHNRDVSLQRVGEYSRAMQRGEWLANHQGIAFYEDGNLADGQHRCAAIAVSGVTIPVLIYAGFAENAIQTIDQVKPRMPGDALKMNGVVDGTLKANTVKQVKEYLHLVEHGVKPKYSLMQLVKSATDAEKALTACIAKADIALSPVTDAPLKRQDVAIQLYLMTEHGGYTMQQALDFMNAVLNGQAPYEGAPQLVLSRLLTRAKHSAKTSDRLAGVARIAVIQKAAKLWSEEQKCSKLVWSKKEGFPLATAPVAE